MPIALNPSQYGRGWREVYAEEPLTTLTQSYLPHREVWVDGAIMSGDRITNQGRMNYRKPVSWFAYVKAALMATPKVWRRVVLGKPF
jgi:hypothetical protein